MVQYSRNIRSSATGSAAPIVELIAGANKPCKVVEIGISLVNATASAFALGRPAAMGITPTTPVALLDVANGDAGACQSRLAVAWGTGPTIPAAFFRQSALPAAIGATVVWALYAPIVNNNPRGITVPAGGSLILWSLTTVSVADIYFVIQE